jgi:hypothetical protein
MRVRIYQPPLKRGAKGLRLAGVSQTRLAKMQLKVCRLGQLLANFEMKVFGPAVIASRKAITVH